MPHWGEIPCHRYLIDQSGERVTVCLLRCASNTGSLLERTMTELMQGRDLENLDAFEVPTFDMGLVSDSSNLESHFIDSNGKLGFGF